MPLAPGQKLGTYEVVARLDRGGTGEVYRAKDRKLARDVAIKTLKPELASDPEHLDRFEREARAASSLNHPNIVHIYDVERGPTPFIAMEYVEGTTLRALLDAGPLSQKAMLPLAVQIAKGLAKAHAVGIVHRDLKPDNLMVTEDGVAKILDFGLAKLTVPLTASESEEATLERASTLPGTILGTVGYMSPEQARGEPADFSSDQFSLGAVLYEMLTGARAFEGSSAVETLAAIVKEPPETLSVRAPDASSELCALIERCLEKAPEQRFRAAADVATELARIEELAARGDLEPALGLRPKRHAVGREEPESILSTGLASVVSGQGTMICVAGEAGIGKTMLVETFLEKTLASRAPIAIGRGKSSERLAGTEAYLPVLEAMESLLRGPRGEAVKGLLRTEAPNWYAHVLRLAREDESTAQAGSQERLKREISAFLEKTSREIPLILFFDDLHWADLSTVDLLAYLGDRFDSWRILILVAYRAEEMQLGKHPFLSVKLDLQTRGRCRELSVPFLSAEDIDAYLALEFPGHRLPAEFARFIHARTEGNPLFMVDLLRYLRDRGIIAEERESWELSRSVPDLEGELPESARSMIERKIDRLDEEPRRVMLVASVQGYEFDSSVVSSVLDVEVAEIEEMLQSLERVHALVQPVEEAQFPDGTFTFKYRFVHGLYQNALYDSLTRARRASLSGEVARVLVERHGDKKSEAASELAHLFEASRDFSHAMDYFCLAAENAVRIYAYEEAFALARRGLALLVKLPDARIRHEQELKLLLATGASLLASKGYGSPEVQETYDRAYELCELLGDTAPLTPVLWGQGIFYFGRADFRAAQRLSEQCRRLAERTGDPVPRVWAHTILGISDYVLGKPASARDHLETGITHYDAKEHRSLASLHGLDPGVVCLSYLAWSLWLLGFHDQAFATSDKAIALAEELSQPLSLVASIGYRCELHQQSRQRAAVKQSTEVLLPLCAEQGFSWWLAAGKMMRGWAELGEASTPEPHLRAIEEGIGAWRAAGGRVMLPYWIGHLAEAQTLARRTDEAWRTLQNALDEMKETGQRLWEAELLRLRAMLVLMDNGASAEAELSLREAVAIAKRQGAKMLELRANVALSRFLQDRGNPAEARRNLSECYSWFREGLDAPDLEEAKALLDSLG